MTETPRPREVNDVAIVGSGLLLWAIALVGAVIMRADKDVIGTCAAGIALGLWGLRYVRRRRARLASAAD